MRRTSLNLDFGLVGEAQFALGTKGTTETIHAALTEIVLRERRRKLLEEDFSEFDNDELERLVWEDPEVE